MSNVVVFLCLNLKICFPYMTLQYKQNIHTLLRNKEYVCSYLKTGKESFYVIDSGIYIHISKTCSNEFFICR